MLHQFSRNELVYGPEGTEILKNSTVAILGIGGVGSFAAEALAVKYRSWNPHFNR